LAGFRGQGQKRRRRWPAVSGGTAKAAENYANWEGTEADKSARRLGRKNGEKNGNGYSCATAGVATEKQQINGLKNGRLYCVGREAKFGGEKWEN
jgi:hypothetical protein